MKIGELARRSGVSVRTLHHYDRIGLLKPAVGGAGGHRLYGQLELGRLQRILALRELEFSLAEIQELLDDPRVSLERVIATPLQRLERDIRLRQIVQQRLKAIQETLSDNEDPSIDDVLLTLEAMNQMNDFSKHYSPEQMEYLARRAELVGPQRMRDVQQEWSELFADFASAQAAGLDPQSSAAGALAKRFQALIDEFTGGDKGIESALGKRNAENPDMGDRMGVDAGLWPFIGVVRQAHAGPSQP